MSLATLFARVDTVTKTADKPHVVLRVWRDGQFYVGSCSAGGGGILAVGETPEAAMAAAVDSHIRMVERNSGTSR